MKQIVNKEKLNDGTDLKRIVLLFARKLWLVLIALLTGAVLGALIYNVYFAIVDGKPTYQSCVDYMIDFNFEEYPNGMDFYNAYTWGQFVVDDKLTGYAMEQLDGVSKQDIKDVISSEMISDYRVLTVKATGKDKVKVEQISKAYENAMPMFADDINEIKTISVWSVDDTEVINVHDKTANAAALGGLLATLLALVCFSIYYVLDDRIYTEADFNRNITDALFLGYDCEKYKSDLEAVKAEFIKEKNVLVCDNVSEKLEEIKKADGCIIQIAWGRVCATALRYDIELLRKNGCELIAVEMCNCNERFLKTYYGR